MNVTLTNNVVGITSVAEAGYKFIQTIQQVLTTATSLVHNVIVDESSSKTLPADGYYIVSDIKLPTTPGSYYYTDGYVIYDPTGAVISYATLLAVDPVIGGFTRNDQNIFCYYTINTTYINAIKSKFLNRTCCCNPEYKGLLDYFTMGLTLIPILVAASSYNEAQRIIELLTACSANNVIDCNCYG